MAAIVAKHSILLYIDLMIADSRPLALVEGVTGWISARGKTLSCADKYLVLSVSLL